MARLDLECGAYSRCGSRFVDGPGIARIDSFAPSGGASLENA